MKMLYTVIYPLILKQTSLALKEKEVWLDKTKQKQELKGMNDRLYQFYLEGKNKVLLALLTIVYENVLLKT